MTITNLKSAEWAAIGLGTERAMVRNLDLTFSCFMSKSLWYSRVKLTYSCAND